ncbi:hypothetical protein J2W42_006232 [Rhizobium tibeticum]|uniref:hypothetical protein n=1 Tax=Rhizobium tibeticum TaxID=501024 RepID=UPI00277FEE65|nr:hypothetical protein [Rhizobium tibeticum]MDP9813359.1 hypothetical protein [Rhizobium tibeticum]
MPAIETTTKKINGGKNGFDDRREHSALAPVVPGLKQTVIRKFQASKGLVAGVDDARPTWLPRLLGSEAWRWMSHLPTSSATL